MKRLATAALALGLALIAAPEGAAAQNACDFYRVKKGDSLREISKAAYGNKEFRNIYRANSAEIGRNPNVLPIGIVLRLPCLDGSMPEVSAPKVAANGAAISFVTANGYLPYTDESLPKQGLFTHLVTHAMMRAVPEQAVEVAFVNDWSAHLETLLPRQAFDASFPWVRPGCEAHASLSAIESHVCQSFVYSDPFYEIVDGFFARAGSGHEAILRPVGYEGLTICRPEGYPTGHLEELGLMPPEVTLVQPTTSYACFGQLMAGRVDLVALDTRTGERVLAEMGLANDVVENQHLFSIQPLRVALHKDNPNGAELIENLNTGLKIMLGTGEWASIVSQGLAEHSKALSN